MTRGHYTIEINRPVEEVFRYMNDPANMKKWMGGLVDVIPLTSGGPEPGAKARQVFVENGRRIELLEEMLIYEPNRRVKIRASGDAFEVTADYTLHDIGGRTRIEYVSDLRMKGLIARLISPIISRITHKRLVEDFDRLRQQVEAL